MRRGVKFFSFVFLVVFLVPFFTISFHSVLHEPDIHCTGHADKHYHQDSHHCVICDSEYSINASVPCNSGFLISTPEKSLVYSAAASQNFRVNILNSFLRGPPVHI